MKPSNFSNLRPSDPKAPTTLCADKGMKVTTNMAIRLALDMSWSAVVIIHTSKSQ